MLNLNLFADTFCKGLFTLVNFPAVKLFNFAFKVHIPFLLTWLVHLCTVA